MEASSSSSIPSAPASTTGSVIGGGVGSNNNNASEAPAVDHQPQQPLMIARTPLNVYLKIAVIRNPTDEVVCNDPERPGMKKRVVVSQLLDGSLTKVGGEDDQVQKNNEKAAETSGDDTKPAASSLSNEAEDKANSSNEKNSNEAPKKKEIPVGSITTVPTYELDIPPTYDIPASYVRYVRPTFDETYYKTVEYNVDAEDETWWRSNTDFGPDARCKILIDGIEQPHFDEGEKEKEKKTAENNDAMDIDQDDNNNINTSKKRYTIQQVLLTNPKYYLHSKHSTQYLIKKYHPKLPLRIMERMIDVLEKETGFDFSISLSQAEKVLVARIPELENIFGWIDGSSGDSSDDDDYEENDEKFNHLPTLAPPPTLKHVISAVYNYWITKRSKLKKPLLRRYHPVTSSNDTNPHMVFRPREKEKRKLRKKRQNDIEAYKKMVVLQRDFEKLKGLCELILKREEVNEMMVELTNGYFEERLGGWLDTTGGGGSRSGTSSSLSTIALDKSRIESILNVPKYYDDGPIVKVVKGAGKKRKRSGLYTNATATGAAGALQPDSRGPSPIPPIGGVTSASMETGGLVPHPPLPSAAAPKKVVVAGNDYGLPAPNFLQPLATRESHHSTNWEGGTVPTLPSYENGVPSISNNRIFRHRPRLGRGGRIIIDRVPYALSTHNQQQQNIITYGAAMSRSGYDVATLGADGPNFDVRNSPRRLTVTAAAARGDSITTEAGMGTDAKTAPKKLPAQRLEDVLHKSFLGKDRKLLSRKIEEICAKGLMEDCRPVAAAAVEAKGAVAPIEETFVDETLVPIEDWVEVPSGEVYGVERYVLGPI